MSEWAIFFNLFSPCAVSCAIRIFSGGASQHSGSGLATTSEHNFIAMCQQRQQRQPVRLRVYVGYGSATLSAPAGRV